MKCASVAVIPIWLIGEIIKNWLPIKASLSWFRQLITFFQKLKQNQDRGNRNSDENPEFDWKVDQTSPVQV